MDITLPAPQHFDQVYVHVDRGDDVMWLLAVGCVVAGVLIIPNALRRSLDRQSRSYCVTGGLGLAITGVLVFGALSLFQRYAYTHAELFSSSWNNRTVSADATSWGWPSAHVEVTSETKARVVNEGLREHYGLQAVRPERMPENGAEYILDGVSNRCSIAYTVTARNNVRIPTRAHIAKVTCASDGSEPARVIDGH